MMPLCFEKFVLCYLLKLLLASLVLRDNPQKVCISVMWKQPLSIVEEVAVHRILCWWKVFYFEGM